VSECPEFKQLIELCNIKAEVPSANTVRKDILNLHETHREVMKNKLQVSIF